MTLRRRLVLTITALLAAGYIAFASISLTLLENSLRSAMDSKLTTLARAASDIVDDNHGQPSVDADDVTQFNALHGSDDHLGIFARDGRLIFGEPAPAGSAARHFSIIRTTAIHNGHNLGFVVAWRDAAWIVTVRRTAILAFVVTGAALCIAAFIFSGIYARAILTPVDRIAALAERIEGSDLSQRLNASGHDELARLCASFDRMLERLEQTFQAERRFVSDASHELRAPLAVVRAETDLALRRDRAPSEYRAALESIGRETARLESLVDDLLQTMRRQALVQTQPVDACELVTLIADRMKNAAHTISVEAVGSGVIAADRKSLERALEPIVHNALTHGGGAVRIAVAAAEEHLSITVADEGPGFTSVALKHATERFWRGDTARSRGGTGLGLSIARVLVEAHGGTLALTNGERGGIVTITLPRSTN